MAHEWHAGVLSQSSWHGLETVQALTGAHDLIAAGERSGAWPVAIDAVRNVGGARVAAGKALVGTYADGSRAVLGVASKGYTHLTPAQWRDLVMAAAAAGARPTGAFALRGGARVLATFEVGTSNGLRSQLCLADSFDRSTGVLAGGSSIRVVCANTLAAAMRRDGSTWGSVHHNSSLPEKVEALGEAVAEVVREGGEVRTMYERALDARLTRDAEEEVWALLFPVPELGAKPTPGELAAHTRARRAREEAQAAAQRAENDEGPTLATVWNGATWVVDRDAAGHAKRTSTPRLESMLFGSRGRRVEEIRAVVRVLLADGTEVDMEASEARARGVDDAQIGRQLLADMLA